MVQALDLLHRCYPIRRCPRGVATRPCIRQECGDCLAPCAGDLRTVAAHDALVAGLVAWIAGHDEPGFTDPVERAEDLVRSLSRQRRFEEAQRMREARDDLLNIRRSYQSLLEALSLRFAALWPTNGDGGQPAVRLNIVWEGRLREAVSLPSPGVTEEIAARLDALWARPPAAPGMMDGAAVAVPQRDLDRLLAIRRWFNESEGRGVVILPGADATREDREQAKSRLLAQAWQALAALPAGRMAGSAF
jgi:hypothetical protein